MPLIKIDRDFILDKIYECRGKIDYENKDALEHIIQLVDLIIQAPLADNQSVYPKIKISR
jgi:hypothetical protein